MRSRSAKGLALPFAQSIDLLGRLRFPEIDNTTNWLVYLVPKKTEILGVRWADSMLAVRVPGRTAVISPR